jgi:putative aldouronate transport system permease protein
MWGLLIAFKEYNAYGGFWASKWVGFKNFSELFFSREFFLMLRNTLGINFLSLVTFFPLPIVLALMLNEVRHSAFKRITQSIVYLPHFLSWVVIASLTLFIFSADFGIVNKVIVAVGRKPISFLTNPSVFWPMIVGQNIWKDTGWGTILFLAAMSSIDVELYEAAVIDGAGRGQQIWHITLPGIRAMIVTLLILRLGNIFSTGFEQIILMQNSLVRNVAVVYDTYAYQQGIVGGKTSLGVAVGFFKGIVGLLFVVGANEITKKLGHDGIY